MKVDMAEVKYSEWCRAEIGLAENDLASVAADETQGHLWIARWGETWAALCVALVGLCAWYTVCAVSQFR